MLTWFIAIGLSARSLTFAPSLSAVKQHFGQLTCVAVCRPGAVVAYFRIIGRPDQPAARQSEQDQGPPPDTIYRCLVWPLESCPGTLLSCSPQISLW